MMETSGVREELRALAAGCAGLSLRHAARRVTLLHDEALRDSGLSLAQVGLMALIATSADDRMTALAARAGLDPSTLSRNLRGLERDGLIEIATVEKDLRRRAVWLTESGLRRLHGALPAWRATQARIAELFPADLLERIATASEKLGGKED